MTWKEYVTIYKLYRDRRPESELVDLANVSGKNIINLCCGSDDIMELCMNRGAKSFEGIDACFAMLYGLVEKKSKFPKGTVELYNQDVMQALEYREGKEKQYDVVFCRQAINYWFSELIIAKLASLMSDGGVFIFNTFANLPSPTPRVKEYTIEGDKFVEISYSIFNKNGGMDVHHIQAREGHEPHMTNFAWIKPNDFMEVLNKHFEWVDRIEKGKVHIYVCKKSAYFANT